MSSTSPDPQPTPSGGASLSDRDRAILAFEAHWWQHAGAKEEEIRGRFGLSAARYYQVLNGLLENPLALADDPLLVGRLRRVRDARVEARAARRDPARITTSRRTSPSVPPARTNPASLTPARTD